jgi:thiol-disulfide isomerase/thioredoxin
VGDIVEDYSFTAHNLDGTSFETSIYEQIDNGKPVFIVWGAEWCGGCIYQAPHVAEEYNDSYGPDADDSAFFIGGHNWGDERQPYPYDEEGVGVELYERFSKGAIPLFAVIGPNYRVYYVDHYFRVGNNQAKVLLDHAINGEIGAFNMEPKTLYFNSTETISLENMFVSPTGEYEVEYISSSSETISGEIIDGNLVVNSYTNSDSISTHSITLKAFSGELETTIDYNFNIHQNLYVENPLVNTNCMVNTPFEIDCEEIFTANDNGDYYIEVTNYNEELMDISVEDRKIVVTGNQSGVGEFLIKAIYEAEYGTETAENRVKINIQSLGGFWVEYGSVYDGFPSAPVDKYANAISWDFGTLEVKIEKIETAYFEAKPAEWRVVNYGEETPEYDSIIGDLQGDFTLEPYPNPTVVEIDSDQKVSGKVSICITVEGNWPIADVNTQGTPKEAREQYMVDSQYWKVEPYPFHIRAYVVSESSIGGGVEVIPGSSELYQNSPNPFNPETSISFYNNMSGELNLSVYNTKGELVKTLIDQYTKAGNHSISFDGSMLNSGVYFYSLKTPTKQITKRMVLVK